MTSTSVDYTSIVTQSWQNVYELISDKNNVDDPIQSGSSRKMVYSREPDKGIEFQGYPYVIVTTPEVRFGKSSLDGSRREVVWEIEVEIHSSDDIPELRGNGQAYFKQIADDIIKTFNDVTNRKVLRGYGMGTFFPNLEIKEVTTIDQEVVYMNRFRLIFSKRLKVSV